MLSIGNGSGIIRNDETDKNKSDENNEASETVSTGKNRKAITNRKKSPKRLKPVLAKDKKRSSVGKKNMPPKKKQNTTNSMGRKSELGTNTKERALLNKEKSAPNKKKETSNSSIASDNEQESVKSDTTSQDNRVHGTPIVITPPKNNIIHKDWMMNAKMKNYHPHNKHNTNKNMVGLQIPVKFLNATKPKKEDAMEMKNKLVKQNPHLDIKKATTMEAHLFNTWLWDSLIYYMGVMIISTLVSTTNDILELKGIAYFALNAFLTFITLLQQEENE